MELISHHWSAAFISANVFVLLHLLAACLLGALIGYERSFHGRAAGMRTYALVCLASTALTAVLGFPEVWYGGKFPLGGGGDPTRVIQGIVTGIGFLGAGMIVREGLTIKGLSTAASIWVTSAVGVLLGLGFHLAAGVSAILTVSLLSGMHWLERRLPRQTLTHLNVRFSRARMPDEHALLVLAERHGFSLLETSYRLGDGGNYFEYQVALKSYGKGRSADLARDLAGNADVLEFRLSPQRD